jgi:hypothetical protein
MGMIVFWKEKRMKKLTFLCAVVLGCLVIGCATNRRDTASAGNRARSEGKPPTERTIAGSFTATIDQSSFPWEYQPVTVIPAPEPKTMEFSAQWLGTDKSVVSLVFGEPEYKIPYPNGFTEECWFYPIRNTKWFVFIDTITNMVIDIHFQNPGQPLMTTGTRLPASGNPLHTPIPEPEVVQNPVPPGYKPYQTYKY